jgi:hypothetical protein
MANPTGFSAPASEVVSTSDISQMLNISSSSAPSTVYAMEEKKRKSHSGAAASASVSTGPAPAPTTTMMTEQNVQLLTATQRTGGTSQGGLSVISSAERSRRCEKARAAFELAEARVALLAAAEEMAATSQAGSAGRRLDDVRSDTGSSGPSQPNRGTSQENPFAGVYSSAPTTTTTITTPTPTIYDLFSAKRDVHILDQILIPTGGISESSGSTHHQVVDLRSHLVPYLVVERGS